MTQLDLPPLHYTSHPSGVECIAVAEDMTFCVGTAFRYLFRSRYKQPAEQHSHLTKALFYLRRESSKYMADATGTMYTPEFLTKRLIYDVILKEENADLCQLYTLLGVYTYAEFQLDRVFAIRLAVNLLERMVELHELSNRSK